LTPAGAELALAGTVNQVRCSPATIWASAALSGRLTPA